LLVSGRGSQSKKKRDRRGRGGRLKKERWEEEEKLTKLLSAKGENMYLQERGKNSLGGGPGKRGDITYETSSRLGESSKTGESGKGENLRVQEEEMKA